jgi:hypothetical protein
VLGPVSSLQRADGIDPPAPASWPVASSSADQVGVVVHAAAVPMLQHLACNSWCCCCQGGKAAAAPPLQLERHHPLTCPWMTAAWHQVGPQSQAAECIYVLAASGCCQHGMAGPPRARCLAHCGATEAQSHQAACSSICNAVCACKRGEGP